MKATELMIGDWVYDSYHKKNIKWDYSEMFCSNGIPVIGRDLEPIPITPEILEKNDWYWGLTSDEEDFEHCVMGTYEPHWVYDEGAGEISLIFPDYTNGGLLKIDDQRFNRHLEFIWNDALYVHELQRALHLCGLDELADNFKV